VRSGLPPKYAIRVQGYAMQEMMAALSGKQTEAYKALRKRGFAGPATDLAILRADELREATGYHAKDAPSNKVVEYFDRAVAAGMRGAMYSDNAVRQAIYRAALEAGETESNAIKLAADYINFRRQTPTGVLRTLGAYVPFFNAALAATRASLTVLGNRSLSNAQKKDARKRYAQSAAMLAALSTLFAMANGDDEDYENMTPEQRALQFTLPGTGGFGIPRRVSIDTLAPIFAEMTYNQFTDNSVDGTQLRGAMSSILSHSLIPVPEPIPAPIKTMMEQWANKNLFTGSPIVGSGLSNVTPHLQYSAATSSLGRGWGEMLESLGWGDSEWASPARVDHAVRGSLGAAGSAVLLMSNLIGSTVGDRPAMSARDLAASVPGFSMPAAKEFNDANRRDMYDLIQRATHVVDTVNRMQQLGDEESAYKMAQDNIELYQMAPHVKRVQQELGKIRRTIMHVVNSDMSSSEKQAEIKRLKEIEMRMLKNIDVKSLREKAGL